MAEGIKHGFFPSRSFFRDDFPFAIRYGANRPEHFNLSRRFQRQFWKITLITEGNGFFVVGDRKFPFRKNTLIIVHPKELTTWDISGSRIMLYNILFDNTLIPAELQHAQDPYHLQRIFSPELDPDVSAPWQIMNAGRKICALIRTIHAEFRNDELNRKEMLRLCFHQLLLLLIRQSERKYRRHPEWTANYVQEYLQKHYLSEIMLRELAAELHLTPERLCRLYKERFGHTIGEELAALRIGNARRLLRETDLPIAEICLRSGFRDLSRFYRTFRALENTSPRKFRNR